MYARPSSTKDLSWLVCIFRMKYIFPGFSFKLGHLYVVYGKSVIENT